MAMRRREVSARARGVPPSRIDELIPDDDDVDVRRQDADVRRQSGSVEHAATADRWRRIAHAAYLRAERRGFAGDAELADWLEAEKEVDEQLRKEAIARQSSSNS
jgi:hypothetical protein